MANNTLYVTIDGNDTNAVIGDPTRPFTFRGAIDKVNTLGNGVTWYVNMSRGTYNLPCNAIVPLRSNVVITGSGPKNTIINVFGIVVDGPMATFQSCSIRTCSSAVLFHILTGSLSLNNAEILVNAGTLYRVRDGVIIMNSCVVTITAVVSNPIVNVTNGGLLVTNTNFFIKVPGGSTPTTSIIGSSQQSRTITLTNVGFSLELNGGPGGVVVFYNVPIVNTAIVQAGGKGTETLILIGLDISAETTSTPYFATNITASVQNIYKTFTYFNMTNYPLVMRNITWSGVAGQPGAYVPGGIVSPVGNPSVFPPAYPTAAIPQVLGSSVSTNLRNGPPASPGPVNPGPPPVNTLRAPNGFNANTFPPPPNGFNDPRRAGPPTGGPGNQANYGEGRELDIYTDYAALNQQARPQDQGQGADFDAWSRDALGEDDMLNGF